MATTHDIGDAVILARKVSSTDPRVEWQARVSPDRARLIVVAVVAPSPAPVVVELLSQAELVALLLPEVTGAGGLADGWICAECGASNAHGRAWCSGCSGHRKGL